MNFKTHAPARREGTTLQSNIHSYNGSVSEVISVVYRQYIGNSHKPYTQTNWTCPGVRLWMYYKSRYTTGGFRGLRC